MKIINYLIILLTIFINTPSGQPQFLSVESYIRKQPNTVFYWKDSLTYSNPDPVFKVVLYKTNTDTLPKQYKYMFLKSWPCDSGRAYFYFVPLSDSINEHPKLITPDLHTIKYSITNEKFVQNQIDKEMIVHNIDLYCQNMSEYRYLNEKVRDYGFYNRVGALFALFACGLIFQVSANDNPNAKRDKVYSAIFYGLGAISIPINIYEYIALRKMKNKVHLIKLELMRQSEKAELTIKDAY
jgi:hypothetical protein